jgi:branched-chain amino acid transport system ATP-binding protein
VSNSAVELHDLKKQFGAFTAIDGISLRVVEGERRAIIGPNGAGKSTLFNLLTGHIRATVGTVRVLGHDVTKARSEAICRLGVGRSFQVTQVFPELTVQENVQFALMCREGRIRRVFGRAWRSMWEDANEVVTTVGLRGLATARAGTLSHGDQRSLELALSLALRPRLLLLDEPTAGMAADETQRAISLVRRLADEYALTLIFTEHDMDVVFTTADRVTVMAQGRVLAEGSPEEIRGNAAVREVYLGG